MPVFSSRDNKRGQPPLLLFSDISFRFYTNSLEVWLAFLVSKVAMYWCIVYDYHYELQVKIIESKRGLQTINPRKKIFTNPGVRPPIDVKHSSNYETEQTFFGSDLGPQKVPQYRHAIQVSRECNSLESVSTTIKILVQRQFVQKTCLHSYSRIV